jgi:hypothetical protein
MKTRRWMRGWSRYALSLLVGLSLAAGAIGALADPPSAGHAPDPPAHPSVKQWVFDVRVSRGKPTVEKTRSMTVAQPYETARVMGRYALELYVGPELLDRVRFNVPLAEGPPSQADKPRKNPFPRPRFEDVTTRIRVQMADHPRAAYLAVVDRATGTVERFEWPPSSDGQLVPIRRAQGAGSATPSARAKAGGKADGGPNEDGGGASDAASKDGG